MRPQNTRLKNVIQLTALASAGALLLAGCQTATIEDSNEVVVIVHDSFPNEEFENLASAATGLDVKVITSGGGEELTTTLALTKDEPLADAFYGIDGFFASRLIENDVVDPYEPESFSARAENFKYDDLGSMIPVTLGATCINIDNEWFAANSVTPPQTYEDLLKKEYENMTVLIDPLGSTTGASFYLGTIANFGETGAIDYWQSLLENGARLEQGWSDAYYGQFTAGSADGTFPIVVSYSSSPAYTVAEGANESSTSALLDTCSTTIEYAGILKNAKNVAGAKKVIDFLYSSEFQDTIADTMYVYPVDESAYIPEEWQDFAPFPDSPNDIPASEIGENRDTWLENLSEKVGL